MFFNRVIKKLVSVALILVIMLTSTSTIFASDMEIYDDYLIETINNDVGYTKLKITNTKTGEIEWLESFEYENGESYMIARSENVEYIIESNNESVIVTRDNEVIDEILLTDTPDEMSDIQSLLNNNSEGSVSTYAYGSWSAPTWRQSSRSFRVTLLSAAIGIVATIFGLPKTESIVITVATTAFGLALKDLYYEICRQYRFDYDNKIYQGRDITYIYEVSNYTGLLGDNSKNPSTWTGAIEN